MNKNIHLMLIASLLIIAGYFLYYLEPNDTPVIVMPVEAAKPHIPATSNTQSSPTAIRQHLRLSNPVVSLNTEQQQLVATLAVEYRSFDRRQTGTLTVSGTPKLEEQSKRFYLQNPTINQLELKYLDESLNKAIHQAVSQYFNQYAVYAPFENNQSLQRPSLVYHW